MLDVEIIEIDDEQAHGAKLLASTLSDSQSRKRGMIDMLGISCAINYLHAKKVRTDSKKSVYKIPHLYEEFKISDIYYGNYRIDVITLYKEKTIKIPKIHVDMDILPHFYFIVQIGAKIKEAKMIGFIESKHIANCPHDSKFYYPTLNYIIGLDKFFILTRHALPTKTLLGKHVDCMGLFLKFIDNDLSSVYKRQLIQHLMNCDSCRARFIDVMEFEKLANNIKHYPELIKKHNQRIETTNYAAQQEEGHRSFEDSLNNLNIQEPRSYQSMNQNFVEREYEPEFQTNNSIDNPNKNVEMFDLANGTPEEQSTKVIDTIFNEIPKIELPQIKTTIGAKQKRAIMTTVALFFVLGSFFLISFKGTNEIIEENTKLTEYEEPFDEFSEFDYEAVEGQAKLISSHQGKTIEDYLVKQPISNKPTYTPSISKIAWEAPESLVKKGTYTKFLQMTGKTIKLNLQNDLLLVNDIPTNKFVKVDIKIASNGDVNSIKIASSSGSELIDNSIKKVVNETLKYMRPPSLGIISKSADITLTLELN